MPHFCNRGFPCSAPRTGALCKHAPTTPVLRAFRLVHVDEKSVVVAARYRRFSTREVAVKISAFRSRVLEIAVHGSLTLDRRTSRLVVPLLAAYAGRDVRAESLVANLDDFPAARATLAHIRAAREGTQLLVTPLYDVSGDQLLTRRQRNGDTIADDVLRVVRKYYLHAAPHPTLGWVSYDVRARNVLFRVYAHRDGRLEYYDPRLCDFSHVTRVDHSDSLDVLLRRAEQSADLRALSAAAAATQ